MVKLEPSSNAWLAQVQEEIIDPQRAIIDPHHHLWKKRFNADYLLEDLWADTGSGHNIVKTLFMECHAFYHRQGPEHLKPLGETAYVTEIARQSQLGADDQAKIAGLVAHADLCLAGESPAMLLEVLDQHRQLSQGLFKGIRHSGAHDKNPQDLVIAGRAPAKLYSDESFRAGLRVLAEQGLTYDTWHYHHQNRDYLALAQAVPECTMILDHFGTPLGVGVYKNRRKEIFEQWKIDIAAIAKCENVYAKIGGLAMPDNGFGWDLRDRPPSSDQFVDTQREYYLHTIECFGPQRCMFESNFPVDRRSLSYHIVYNGFKKMVANFSETEKHAMFYGTAAKVYSIED